MNLMVTFPILLSVLQIVMALLDDYVGPSPLPERFIGTWKHDHDVNIDEWLKSKVKPGGVGWVKRRIFNNLHPTKVFEQTFNNGYSFNVKTLTPIRNIVWKDVNMGTEFVGPRLDGQVRITFDYNLADATLVETHKSMQHKVLDVLQYTQNGDELIMNLDNDGIQAKRIFKRSTE